MSNSVTLTGKISRAGALRYTPSGVPVAEFTVAVPQQQLDKKSVGHFEAVIFGETAEDFHTSLRIGKVVQLQGALWTREYKNRQGIKCSETKIIVHSIGGTGEEKRR